MVYIQSDSDRKLPHHFDCACGLYGAIDSGLDYRLTSFEEVASGKFDNLIRTNLFIGSVEYMREVFKRVGIDDVRVPVNSNRDHTILTLKEAYDYVANGDKLFIKPVEIKLFTGLVLDGFRYTALQNLSDDTKVMAYTPFTSEILSESRVYVNNHQVVDIRNYSGDTFIYPPKDYCDRIVDENRKTFPKAYTMDVGVMDSTNAIPECVIIEFNDFWAIGNYGIPNDLYLDLLRDRYFEIMSKL